MKLQGEDLVRNMPGFKASGLRPVDYLASELLSKLTQTNFNLQVDAYIFRPEQFAMIVCGLTGADYQAVAGRCGILGGHAADSGESV